MLTGVFQGPHPVWGFRDLIFSPSMAGAARHMFSAPGLLGRGSQGSPSGYHWGWRPRQAMRPFADERNNLPAPLLPLVTGGSPGGSSVAICGFLRRSTAINGPKHEAPVASGIPRLTGARGDIGGGVWESLLLIPFPLWNQ
jgi:hypothetical protein